MEDGVFGSSTSTVDMATARAQLALDGTLRVAINLSNFLLVSGKDESGAWQGVAPSLAAALASDLGVALQLVPYKTPSEVADAVGTGAWSVALIGNEPARATHIAFSEPYVEIEASYLVPPGSSISSMDEVDVARRTIAAYRGSAFDLWLTSNLKAATLVHGADFEETFQLFQAGGVDAMASLKPKLLSDVKRWPGSKILPGRFMAVQQSMGVASSHKAAAAFVSDFVRRKKQEGMVASLIDKHQAHGLTVAV